LASRTNIPLFDFKALVFYDKSADNYAAYCLETGGVATADSPQKAEELIVDVIQSELHHAIALGNFRNLFSHPAPKMLWFKWLEAAEKNAPRGVTFNIKSETPETPTPKKKPMTTKVAVASTGGKSAA
jgi:hypothetical protein